LARVGGESSADEAESHGLGAGLAACAHVQLPQNRRDVVLDRFRGDEKTFCDVRVAQSLREVSGTSSSRIGN
jgi:hypothetical protein